LLARESLASQGKGGGFFKVTANLQTAKFGSARVFNSPLAEANIVGRAIGMATRGLKPVVEINSLITSGGVSPDSQRTAVLRWRSGNEFSSPMVMRVPIRRLFEGAPF